MKQNVLKAMVVALLFSIVCGVFPTVAMAENLENTIMPRFTYIVDAENDLSINDDVATVSCWVNGQYGDATKAKVVAELQVKSSATNWIPVAIWTDTQNSYRAAVYETKTINPNNIYRVKATYTVWEGSQSETITIISDEM